MVKILLVVPYPEVLEQFRELAGQVNDPDILLETTHIAGTIDERITACDADIVLARGITFRAIKKALPGTHLVEIAMSGFVVAAALAECLRRTAPRRIALLTHDAALANVESMSALCGVPVDGYDVTDEQEIDRVLDQALENGVEAFIGGLTACQRCDARGLPRVHIKTGETAIRLAIAEAVNAARTINLERAKTRLMQSVLNSSRDVLIAVDRDGLVTALNNQARLLYQLPLSQELSGQPIGGLVGGDEWRKTLETGSETETLRSYGEKSYLLNCKPINVDGRAVGVL
ncbi:MAG: PrpR N-terminal domain-containing protein, partial [Oscillospiraceae bacterium]